MNKNKSLNASWLIYSDGVLAYQNVHIKPLLHLQGCFGNSRLFSSFSSCNQMHNAFFFYILTKKTITPFSYPHTPSLVNILQSNGKPQRQTKLVKPLVIVPKNNKMKLPFLLIELLTTHLFMVKPQQFFTTVQPPIKELEVG